MTPIGVVGNALPETRLVFIYSQVLLSDLLGALLKDDLSVFRTNTAGQMGSRDMKPRGSYRCSSISFGDHQRFSPSREAVKRKPTRWSWRSSSLMAPGEHFSTPLIPDKAEDFLTTCMRMAAQTNIVSMSAEGNQRGTRTLHKRSLVGHNHNAKG